MTSVHARALSSAAGEKPHCCDICGKRYADLKTMKTHRYMHLNLKPFNCHLCSFTCTKKDVIIAHFRRTHGTSARHRYMCVFVTAVVMYRHQDVLPPCVEYIYVHVVGVLRHSQSL